MTHFTLSREKLACIIIIREPPPDRWRTSRNAHHGQALEGHGFLSRFYSRPIRIPYIRNSILSMYSYKTHAHASTRHHGGKAKEKNTPGQTDVYYKFFLLPNRDSWLCTLPRFADLRSLCNTL